MLLEYSQIVSHAGACVKSAHVWREPLLRYEGAINALPCHRRIIAVVILEVLNLVLE
jgi:hypothetical protein